MKIHRFITDFKIQGKDIEILDSKCVHQIANVLKLRADEHIVLTNGKDGMDYTVNLTESHKKKVSGVILSKEQNNTASNIETRLYLAILKNDNFELSIQKAVELGVQHIIPIVSDRTIKKSINAERIKTIIKEACEQSGQSILPTLGNAMPFENALKEAVKSSHVYFFDTETQSKGRNNHSETTSLFIGPEGGWSDKERATAKEAGAYFATLGKTVLRAETAVIVAVYSAVHDLL